MKGNMAIRDYFPKREKMKSLQVKLPEQLVHKVQKEMKRDSYQTWQEFIAACFMAYLESRKVNSNDSDSEK